MRFLLALLILPLIGCAKPQESAHQGVITIEHRWLSEDGQIWDLTGSGLSFRTTRTLPLDGEVASNVRLVGDYFAGTIEIERLDNLQKLSGTYKVSSDQLELCLPYLLVFQCEKLKPI